MEHPHAMHVQPQSPSRGPSKAVGYGFTDLRIYPPPSPSRCDDARRAPGNQNVAGRGVHSRASEVIVATSMIDSDYRYTYTQDAPQKGHERAVRSD